MLDPLIVNSGNSSLRIHELIIPLNLWYPNEIFELIEWCEINRITVRIESLRYLLFAIDLTKLVMNEINEVNLLVNDSKIFK